MTSFCDAYSSACPTPTPTVLVPTTTPSPLPHTGSDGVPVWGLVGLVFVLVGVALVMALRPRGRHG